MSNNKSSHGNEKYLSTCLYLTIANFRYVYNDMFRKILYCKRRNYTKFLKAVELYI